MSWVPVLDGDRHVVGTLSLSDLMRAYRRELLASVARVSDLGPGSVGFEVKITADSPAAGKKLRAAGLPKGVIVTSITRGGEVVLPSGRYRHRRRRPPLAARREHRCGEDR